MIRVDRILNKYLDPEFTNLMETEFENRGVKLALNRAVTKFVGSEGSVEKVVTTEGEYEADLVIVCWFPSKYRLSKRTSRHASKRRNCG